MEHSFNVDIAKEVGMASAVIFKSISFWIDKNEANKVHEVEGEYWTYNSIRAFTELFPYLTEKQVRTAIQKLVDTGYIKEGCYNKMKYDRTRWYAYGERGKEFKALQSQILPKGQMEVPEKANGSDQKGEPIPFTITDTITDSSNISANKRKKFVPPTLEEVQEYAKEKALVIDPKFFYEYFTEGDWHDKKGDPVKNWKTKMLTWNRTELDKHPEKAKQEKIVFV